MDYELCKKWWEIIFRIVQELDEIKAPYSFDASTSLFVHGISNFEMDDLDIMVQWDYFEAVHRLFQKYDACPINKGGFWQFNFFIDGLEVHIMSAEFMTCLEKDSERVAIEKGNNAIWSKSVHFYRRHTTDTYLAGLIDTFLREREENH